MNNYYCTQPDSRDDFSRLIEMFSPAMTPQEESSPRSISANSYGSDYDKLMSVLNGKILTSSIPSKTIDNAGEYYKQVNKALLIFRDLTNIEKVRESNEIDSEAFRLKNEWYRKLQLMRISII